MCKNEIEETLRILYLMLSTPSSFTARYSIGHDYWGTSTAGQIKLKCKIKWSDFGLIVDALRIGLEWDLDGELSDPREREISPSIAGNCDFIKERTRLSCLHELYRFANGANTIAHVSSVVSYFCRWLSRHNDVYRSPKALRTR